MEVKPNSRENAVEQITAGVFKVKLKAPPSEGKANRLLLELMADYFKVSKSQIEIKTGKTAKTKVLVIYG